MKGRERKDRDGGRREGAERERREHKPRCKHEPKDGSKRKKIGKDEQKNTHLIPIRSGRESRHHTQETCKPERLERLQDP
jgi:hypothetical protein